MQKGRVIGVVTRSTKQRTAEGVGPGSTYADYLKAYSNSRWKKAGYRGSCERGSRSYGCILTRVTLPDAPLRSTSFTNKAVRNGRVGFAVVMVGLGRLMLDDTDLE